MVARLLEKRSVILFTLDSLNLNIIPKNEKGAKLGREIGAAAARLAGAKVGLKVSWIDGLGKWG